MVKQFVKDGKIRVIRTGEIFTVSNISPEDEMCWRVNVQESDTYFYDYEVEILWQFTSIYFHKVNLLREKTL